MTLERPRAPLAVVAVCSNKGGVGKTTVATNLAVYLRALHEELPVLLLGLDDQCVIDRMFRLKPPEPGEGNLKHGWAERCLDRVIQLGQYGVSFVPPPPDTALLKHRAQDPHTLRRILERTAFPGPRGVVIVDTKSDLEALTQNAVHASDRVILPVADRASLEEAAKIFALLERLPRGRERGRILLTLVDRRARIDRSGRSLHERLVAEIESRGWPRYENHLARSPRLETLISAGANPGSILHHARGTLVHDQMRWLTEEVMKEIGITPTRLSERAKPRPPVAAVKQRPRGEIKSAFLAGLRRK